MPKTPMSQRLNLYDLLHRLTIAELKSAANSMNLKIKSNLRKETMVRALSTWILENTDIIIEQLLTYELRIYQQIINNPENPILFPSQLFRHPFDSIDYDNQRLYSYIAPDLAEKIEPLLPEAIRQREKSGEEDVENHIVGLLNLRGSITEEEFMNILYGRIKGADMYSLLTLRFSKFLVGNDIDDERVYESPFTFGTDFNPFDDSKRDPHIDPKKFPDKAVAKAAIMPYPHIGGREYDELKAKMISLGFSEEETIKFLLDRWIEKQNESSNLFQGLESLQFDSFDEVQELLPYLTNYVNRLPFWKFNGWSSEETMSRAPKLRPDEMPRISIGPNLRAMGITSFEQIQEMAARGEEFPDMPPAPKKKVGRNDPCPCGSGKKYKHCCGR